MARKFSKYIGMGSGEFSRDDVKRDVAQRLKGELEDISDDMSLEVAERALQKLGAIVRRDIVYGMVVDYSVRLALKDVKERQESPYRE